MAKESIGSPFRRFLAFYVPTMVGFTIDLTTGSLMTLGGFLAWLYGQLIWRHGEAKAKARKDWVLADNESIRPDFVHAQKEREALAVRLGEVESKLAWAMDSLRESMKAERDIAIASLITSGDMTIEPKHEQAKTSTS